jgi:hypothetical protein
VAKAVGTMQGLGTPKERISSTKAESLFNSFFSPLFPSIISYSLSISLWIEFSPFFLFDLITILWNASLLSLWWLAFLFEAAMKKKWRALHTRPGGVDCRFSIHQGIMWFREKPEKIHQALLGERKKERR